MSEYIEVDGLRVGPAMYRQLHEERDALAEEVKSLRAKLLNGRDIYYGVVEQCQDAEIRASQAGMRLRQYQEKCDALAAHVERLIRGGRYLHHELQQWSITERDPETSAAMYTWGVIVSETPTTSLARRDLLKQAEALEQAALDVVPQMERMSNWLVARAVQFRRQAEQGD